MDRVPAPLGDVLITADLARRPTRSPDYAVEGRALTALAEAMADSPQTILQKLVEDGGSRAEIEARFDGLGYGARLLLRELLERKGAQ